MRAMNESENTTFQCFSDPPYYRNTIGIVVDWIIVFIGLPLVCVAGYALIRLKKDRAAPVLAINLLLSDLLQIAITIVFIITRFFDDTFEPSANARDIARLFVRLGLISNLGFMFAISLERYLAVAFSVWYRIRSLTFSILISICVWSLSTSYATLDYIFLSKSPRFSLLLFSSIFLLPAPFIVGFFFATWKALKGSMSVRNEGRRMKRVLGVLGLILGIYTVLFLPFSIRNFYFSMKDDNSNTEDLVRDLSSVLTSALVYLSPLADPFLYIFMRKDIRDTMIAFPCCKTLLVKIVKKGQGRTESSHGESPSNPVELVVSIHVIK